MSTSMAKQSKRLAIAELPRIVGGALVRLSDTSPPSAHRTPLAQALDRAVAALDQVSLLLSERDKTIAQQQRQNVDNVAPDASESTAAQVPAPAMLCAEFSKQLKRVTHHWCQGPTKIAESMAAYRAMALLESTDTGRPAYIEHNQNLHGYDLLYVPRDARLRCQMHEAKSTQATGKCDVNFKLPVTIEKLSKPPQTIHTSFWTPIALEWRTALREHRAHAYVTALIAKFPPVPAPVVDSAGNVRKDGVDLTAWWAAKVIGAIDEWGRGIAMANPPLDARSLAVMNQDAHATEQSRTQRRMQTDGTDDGYVIIVMDDDATPSVRTARDVQLFGPFVVAYVALHYFSKGRIEINLGSTIHAGCGHCHRLVRLEKHSDVFERAYRVACRDQKKQYLAITECIGLLDAATWTALLFTRAIECK